MFEILAFNLASPTNIPTNQDVIAIVLVVEEVSTDRYGYKPPRDIGRPRRTGPGAGRIF